MWFRWWCLVLDGMTLKIPHESPLPRSCSGTWLSFRTFLTRCLNHWPGSMIFCTCAWMMAVSMPTGKLSGSCRITCGSFFSLFSSFSSLFFFIRGFIQGFCVAIVCLAVCSATLLMGIDAATRGLGLHSSPWQIPDSPELL